jgi:UDP-N-acetyl-D-glucosamine dehydrogenase
VRVLGIDVDPKKVEFLNSGQSYIRHAKSSDIAELVGSGKFSASTDLDLIKEVEAILICVRRHSTKTGSLIYHLF